MTQPLYDTPGTPIPDPFERARDLASAWDTLPTERRRQLLQALTYEELMALSHTLANKHRTPDLAYRFLRACMEPEPWDIHREEWVSGSHYVWYYGGKAAGCRPAGEVVNLEDLWEMAQGWFASVYPHKLIDLGTVPLLAPLVVCNG
jgi:hypothetical protein